MTRSRSLSAMIVAAMSAILGGCLYWPERPAPAGGQPSGAVASPDSAAPGGAYASPDSGAYGGTYGSPGSGAYGGAYGSPGSGAYGGAYGSPGGGAYVTPGGGPYGGVYQGGYQGAYGWTGGAVGIETEPYDPVINPRDFVSWVSNRYFRLRPGAIFTYEKTTPQGTELTEIEVTRQKRRVMGVLTTVCRHRTWLNGQLKEDARDFYAQDRRGNVWYFGEEVDNYENGMLKDHRGSWEAGINGAKPGIVMLNQPVVGVTYRQEYHRGQAEDMATVVALNRTVSVGSGTFHGCVQTRDWSLIDRTLNEYKYYCPGVGYVALQEAAPAGGNSSQLVRIANAGVNASGGYAFNARRSAFNAQRRAYWRHDRDGDID